MTPRPIKQMTVLTMTPRPIKQMTVLTMTPRPIKQMTVLPMTPRPIKQMAALPMTPHPIKQMAALPKTLRSIKQATVHFAFMLMMIFTINLNHIQAQALKVTAGNTLIGAANGALIGLGAIGITGNGENLTPLRIGVGAGTLYGLGVGMYEVSKMDRIYGSDPVYGVFHTSEFITMIPLFDTMYGGATGGVVGMAISLIGGTSIKKGFVQGGSIGIFGGFIFGLVDAFYLSKDGFGDSYYQVQSTNNDGIIHMAVGNRLNIGLLQPVIHQTPSVVQGSMTMQTGSALQIAQFKVSF